MQERHRQLRAARQEMHGAKWWSSRAHALEHIKQADRYRALTIYLEYVKPIVSEFSFNLNGNLRNSVRRKLGPVFCHPVVRKSVLC